MKLQVRFVRGNYRSRILVGASASIPVCRICYFRWIGLLFSYFHQKAVLDLSYDTTCTSSVSASYHSHDNPWLTTDLAPVRSGFLYKLFTMLWLLPHGHLKALLWPTNSMTLIDENMYMFPTRNRVIYRQRPMTIRHGLIHLPLLIERLIYGRCLQNLHVSFANAKNPRNIQSTFVSDGHLIIADLNCC